MSEWRKPGTRILICWIFFLVAAALSSRAEVILQFFNNSWQEIIEKMPEIAEGGYTALWLPPPQKASGDLSVGYDLWDPFDIGGHPQRTGGRTRYGTEEEMLRLIRTAHRFGLRVYFDNIMNHRAFDMPGYDENTPIELYPGMLPEDFHVRVTEDGFYRPWDNTVNWGSTWEVQNRYLSGLIDIAHETPNANFGRNEGDTHPKISFVRHPNNPEFYDYHPTEGHVGFGSASITTNVIAENPGFYSEDVGGYLMRSIRWLVDYTKLDGLRLDAVKHVPAYFFGQLSGAGKDESTDGYLGQAQWQFNQTRGFSEANLRASVFDTEIPRVSLMVFGEHMGEPPGYGEYFDSGMRLLDAKTHSTLNNIGWSGDNMGHLEHSDYVEHIQFGKNLGVYYAKSHDDDVAHNEHLHYAINLTRAGLPNIYTDNNRQAPTLGESGGAFPRHANTRPFGQFGDSRIPNLVHIHNSFARGWQIPRWADSEVVAYERRDKRENGDMTDGDGTVVFFMFTRNYSDGQYREIPTSFPDGSILWQYSDGGGKFYHQVTDGQIKVTVPPAGHFVFSWRSPEESHLWRWGGGKPIMIYSDGKFPDTVSYVRREGPDGDSQFNPHGLPNRGYPDGVTPEPFTYMYTVPRVTSPTNLSFFAHVDGSAYNVLFKLNGGVPLNSTNHHGGDPRDHPPGWDTTDVFLGYEQADFHCRIGPEKFGSVDSSRNKIGSPGSETFIVHVGSGITTNLSDGANDWDGTYTAAWIYFDPMADDEWSNPQMSPLSGSMTTQVTLRVKVGYQNLVNRMHVYYTTDGQSWPEGAGGMGIGSTKVAAMNWYADGAHDGTGTPVWWTTTIQDLTNGMTLRFKIGGCRQQDGSGSAPWDVPYPNSWHDIGRKQNMMGTWKITNFNPSTVVYRPHNDYGLYATGLVEGFNFIAVRAFLQREGAAEGNGKRASICNTFYQTFYYDAEPPGGEVRHPAESETLSDNRYGVVVRTDPTVVRVWYNIEDASALNDDGQTGNNFGNGTNALGQTAWVEAQRVNPSILIDSDYPIEWRFNYLNVPASNAAVIRVKLAEYSSSTNPYLSDAEGRFTTLARNVAASGPDYSMYVAWPQKDGDTIGHPYDTKVRFSKALADWDEQVTRRRFIVRINGAAQDRDLITFNYDVTGNDHEMVFPLPDLWNGDPNYLHEIEVLHTNAAGSGVTLYADRRVRAEQSTAEPAVLILDPPEFDLNGAKYEIVLPDVAVPTTEQRQHNVQVQTGADAQSVWITFTNSTGYVVAIASSTNDLTGTLSVTQGVATVTGTGTAFHEELSAGNVVQIDTHRLVVAGVQSSNQFTLTSAYPGSTASGLTGKRIEGNPTAAGQRLYWYFLWTNIQQGVYTIIANADTDGNPATVEASAQRTLRVIFRQIVDSDPDNLDDDNDGLYDEFETVAVNLPDTNPETWSNGDVHMWLIRGRTDPLRPDTDGDGLPDGLELGWVTPMADTDTGVDTNGDGWPNFISDRDPPIFNTTDNWEHPRYNFNASRTDQLGGSMTDPNRADTDGDGLTDEMEDLNRNGRVDVGLLGPGNVVTNVLRNWFENRSMYLPMVYHSSRVDRDALPAHARFLETDPNNSDTIGDGMSDGAADANANGRVDMLLLWPEGTTTVFHIEEHPQYLLGMDAASQAALAAVGESQIVSRAIHYDALFAAFGRPRRSGGGWDPATTNVWPRILFLELDPLVQDTNEDGLRDGWKVRYGLDPFDDGWYNLRTGEMNPTNTQQGADGDLTGDGINNTQHQSAGTDPRMDVNIPAPPGSITIGPGPVIGQLGGVDIHEEFTDWTWADLRALDYYQGAGPNSKQGDVYRGWDGYDTSRDLVAFYTRDGGASGSGGDDKFYFRVDLHDLQAHAEDEHLDIYVVIDTGNPALGERVLPDEVDTLTDMRWELVVAVYNWAHGRVYVDMDPDQNTSMFTDDLFTYGGVVARGEYFLGAYYNSQLDAVEFAIDRQALVDVGYIGDPDVLNYQVFTTRPGTQNSPPGPGDIGGRSDIRDSIYNDYIAEDDHWAQAGLKGVGSVLRSWIPGDNRPSRTKVAMLIHGNQAVLPGSSIQNLIHNGDGAGYHRPLITHEVLRQPLNLHITPTLASAIEWARADTNKGPAWRDGPAFNAWISELAATNIVYLLAGTFSDHMLPYFTPAFNRDNADLARAYLEHIYGVTFTTNSVFWTPERLLDGDVFEKIADMGYQWTVLDQNTHLWWWFGRMEALGENGYSINRMHGIRSFVINNLPTSYRFANQDGGLNLSLRGLLNRRARGPWERVITIFSNWEDFGSSENATAYDRNIRWMANRPWIRLVGFEEITTEALDLGGGYKSWAGSVVQRGTPVISKRSHDWVDHASRGNYDNWYLGDSLAEGLQNKIFDIRPGTPMPDTYGMMYTEGVVTDTWDQVMGMVDTNLAKLARSALHASVFQAAFHNNDEHNLSRWSTGEYIYPTTQSNALADFAKMAQAQTRTAAIFAYADIWAATAGILTTTVVTQADVDLDGENEYVLANNRILGIFERIGGRMIAAWVRDPSNGRVFQVAGNQVGYAGSETEEEGAWNAEADGTVVAYRTSCFKDWWAGTTEYVNMLYTFTPVANGWEMQSADSRITKTITLAPDTNVFSASYAVAGALNGGVLHVRHGLSPNLYNLLLEGQRTLGYEEHDGGVMTLANHSAGTTVSALVGYQDAGHNASFNTAAVDDAPATFYTVNMRNQVQTHQVELSGTNTFNFSLGFMVEAGLSAWEQWCEDWDLDPNEPDLDFDEDGFSNWDEFIAGTNPKDKDDFLRVTDMMPMEPGAQVRFDSKSGRRYYVWYSNNQLFNPTWSNATPVGIWGTGEEMNWTDDGSGTDPMPNEVPYRFYRVEVERPE